MHFLKSKFFKTIIYIFALIGVIFSAVFIGMQWGLFNVRGSNATRNISLGIPTTPLVQDCLDDTKESCDWNKTKEWKILKAAFTKDSVVLNKVSKQTGVSTKMIVATVSPEQIRFFTSEREKFKKVFEPLKILVSLSKFSLGVSGIKEDTAKKIEEYANDPTGEFYPGPNMNSLLAYSPGVNHDTELYKRLTDEHDHYFSYLYTAIYIKEIQNQWAKAGFDITKEPGVIITLFNLGFNASKPNANPTVAGSIITLAGHSYSYGELGALIYNSNEL